MRKLIVALAAAWAAITLCASPAAAQFAGGVPLAVLQGACGNRADYTRQIGGLPCNYASLSLNFAAGLYKTTTPYVRTNYVPNNGSATGWVGTTGNGITWASTGSGVEFGMPYVEWRISGTAAATGILNFQATTSTTIAAVNGQSWVHSAGLRLVSGSFAGLTGLTQNVAMYSSAPAYIAELATPVSVLGMGASAPSNYFVGGTAANAGFAFVLPYWQASFNIGAVINATIRVYADQIEQGRLYPSSWIATTGAAASVATTQSTNPADVGALSYTGPAGYAPDCNGNLVSFAANNPRITCAGVLIEEARTNSVLWSQQLDNAAWNKNAGGTGSAPVVTPDAALAPDGTMTADQVVFNAGAGTTGGDLSILAQNLTWTSGASYAGGFWIKGAAGQGLLFRHVGANTYTCITTTGSWQRVSSVETGLGTSGALGIGIRQGQGCGTLNATATVLIWQVDVQAGSFITSPILTTSATVTRPADVMSYGGLSIAYPLTLAGQSLAGSTGGQQMIAQLDDGSNSNRATIQYASGGTGATVTSSGNVTQANVGGGAVPANQAFGLASRVASNDVKIATAGALGGSSTTATLPVGTMSALRLGAGLGAGIPLNGLIQQIRIYPYAANDNELQYRSVGNW